MINRYIKKAAAVLVAAAIIASFSTVSSKADKLPDTLKVGLFYKGSSVNTEQSIFDVSAQAGMLIGFSKDGSFAEIYREAGQSVLYVRKDSFYYDSGSGLKEFDPSGSKASGKKFGPYHIKIGNDLPDAKTAAEQASYFRQAGIDAFIAYNDAWQVWTGEFIDEKSAGESTGTLVSLIGDTGYEIIKPSSERIAVINGQYKTLCIFGSKTASFQIRPAPDNNPPVVKVKGKEYRGAIEVKRLAGSDMTVINVVSVRDYLYGNVPPEIGGRSPAEALKAQAVASKMYALNNKGKHGSTGFDICATTHCQVYKGYSVEIPECNKAIDAVYDKVITYNGEPVKHVYYFASGGGSTEDVRNVWGSSYPYLVSVEDKYEKIYTWTKTLRASDVSSMLPKLGSILGISITRTAPTGRVTQLAVTGASRGEPEYYTNEKCRTLFGLDSQLYTITSDADVFVSGVSEKTGSEKIGADRTAEADAEKKKNEEKKDESTSDINEGQKPAAEPDGSEASVKKSNAAVVPEVSDPIRTQLGGKKVLTADGVKSLKGTNNKITVLGADGVKNKAAVVPETYVFTGKGWGHAVGMSQEGAIGMGKAGISYDEILTHYFQGTRVE